MKKGIIIGFSVLLGSLVIGCIIFLIYLSFYYKAVDVSLESTSTTLVTETKDYYLLESVDDSNGVGIIFYPGAKVEALAYVDLMRNFSDNGYTAVVCKIPLNFSFFGMSAADCYKDIDGVDEWYLMGHSLGGTVASMYIDNKIDVFSGLILLGSYSSTDLSETDLKVLSIIGEYDNILNKDSYEESKVNLPDSTVFIEDLYFNHSGFGSYGLQKHDKFHESGRTQQIDTFNYVNNFIF